MCLQDYVGFFFVCLFLPFILHQPSYKRHRREYWLHKHFSTSQNRNTNSWGQCTHWLNIFTNIICLSLFTNFMLWQTSVINLVLPTESTRSSYNSQDSISGRHYQPTRIGMGRTVPDSEARETKPKPRFKHVKMLLQFANTLQREYGAHFFVSLSQMSLSPNQATLSPSKLNSLVIHVNSLFSVKSECGKKKCRCIRPSESLTVIFINFSLFICHRQQSNIEIRSGYLYRMIITMCWAKGPTVWPLERGMLQSPPTLPNQGLVWNFRSPRHEWSVSKILIV